MLYEIRYESGLVLGRLGRFACRGRLRQPAHNGDPRPGRDHNNAYREHDLGKHRRRTDDEFNFNGEPADRHGSGNDTGIGLR